MSKKSILQSEKECFMCGTTRNLERHHVIFEAAGRKISDKLGLTTDLRLRRFAQTCYEDKHSREEWVERIGRNYL